MVTLLLDTLYLCSVGQEYGWGQVACDAAQHVDDGDSQPASQLLYVPQHRHLEKHWHQAVQDPTDTDKTGILISETNLTIYWFDLFVIYADKSVVFSHETSLLVLL